MATPDWPVDRSLAMSYWQLASNYTRHFPRRRTHNETTRIPCVPALSHPAPSPQKERLGLAIFHFLYYLRLIGLRSHYYERCDLFPVFYLWDFCGIEGARLDQVSGVWVVSYGFDLRDLRLRAHAAVGSARYGVHCGSWPQDFFWFVLFMFGICPSVWALGKWGITGDRLVDLIHMQNLPCD
jgi:hypothetical protein